MSGIGGAGSNPFKDTPLSGEKLPTYEESQQEAANQPLPPSPTRETSDLKVRTLSPKSEVSSDLRHFDIKKFKAAQDTNARVKEVRLQQKALHPLQMEKLESSAKEVMGNSYKLELFYIYQKEKAITEKHPGEGNILLRIFNRRNGKELEKIEGEIGKPEDIERRNEFKAATRELFQNVNDQIESRMKYVQKVFDRSSSEEKASLRNDYARLEELKGKVSDSYKIFLKDLKKP